MFRFNKNNNGNGLGTVAAALCAFTFIFPSYALGEVLDDYDYPYVADFESITSVHDDALDTDPVNDVNGQADWTVQGDWGMAGDHGAWINHGGSYHLDNNPSEIDQFNHQTDQNVTMNGWVDIPTTSIHPELSFYYKLNLLHIYDDVFVEVQTQGTTTWTELKKYEIENNQANYAQSNISLADYKGQSIRIRFRQHFSSATGPRLFVIDDLRMGERVVEDFDYPYANDFETATSVHDNATDSDPSNDVNGQSDWNLQGDWGMSGTHGNWSSYSGTTHLDNNPQEEDQHAHNVEQFATMKGWVEIPATGTPVLNYRYKLNLLHIYDRVSVYIQTADSDVWEVLSYYSDEQNNSTYAQETISLDAYKGQSIRIRFQQVNYGAAGGRMFVLDDFRIGAQTVEDYDYPYENNFDVVTSVHDDASDNNAANDINGQADWNLQGDWGITGAHGVWSNHSGATHLDNNPIEESQRAHNAGHLATLNGMVDIPTASVNPQLSFYYKLNLLHIYDYQSVEIQVAGSSTWNELKRYTLENNHANYTQDVISLADYKGQAIRIRFRQSNYAIEGARLFVVDDLRIGDQTLDDYDFPYENDFESATSVHDATTDSDPSNDVNGQADWNLQGTWGMSGSHGAWSSYSATQHLDNNPAEIDQAHYNMDQLATMKGLVEIPVGSVNPVLNYHYKLNLFDIYDRVNIYIQTEGSETWEVLSYYSDEQNNTTYAQETISLDAYKGQSIRIRFQQVNTNVNGARLFVLDDFRIGELQVEDYDYPYENDFESATSVHDNATDTDPSNDINGRADWNTQGDWGMAGAHNTWTNHSGAFHLDGNVTEENQRAHNVGHIATLNGVVNIPADSVTPELSYYYKLNLLDTYDDIFVEIQTAGTNSWMVLTTYEPSNNHGDYTRESLSLVAYKGQSIRIRFRQSLKHAAGPRMFIVDDLRIGEQQLDDYDYPYVNDFESVTSVHDDATDNSAGNDINGQADWNLQGDWGINGTHNDWTSYSGIAHLDNNPGEKDQRQSNKRQYATMNGVVDIPAATVDPVLSYFYKLNLIYQYEHPYVEIQTAGSQDWTVLKSYSIGDNQTIYTPEVIDLTAYKGQSIRIRFRQEFSNSTGARLFVIDDLRIAERNADTDADGIADTHDACPATPVGETIDANGCSATQRDTDNDGINDAIDICPATPVGETADLEGCSNSQKDEDSDGVINVNDQCPSTPTGETVDINGCSLTQLDSDNDTVNDATDICPNTPAGETADAQGCSNSQKDSDNDTINDALDICPNTPTGETADANGCSATQRDTDNDTVNDATDACPNTPAGEAVDAIGCSATQRDSDNDGTNDANDSCPNTPTGETADGQGCSTSQKDSDSDGVNDAYDICPNTPTGELIDTQGCSDSQKDTDNDGHNDAVDLFPSDPTEWADLDGDGIGDNADTDRDGDNVANTQDAFPNDPTEWADMDNDGIGDNTDTDRDGDGVANVDDYFPDDPNASTIPGVTITEPATLSTVGVSPIEVSGTLDDPNAILTINGVSVSHNGGAYQANVALEEGHNAIIVRAIDQQGKEGTATISVSLDKTPPQVTIESPTDGQVFHTNSIIVTGLVNDVVRGTITHNQAGIIVNGVQGTVANRSYMAENVILTEGENTITVAGSDSLGNTAIKEITVTYQPTTNATLDLHSGQTQTGTIKTTLAQPLEVKATDSLGNPIANKAVVFRVIQGSGQVAADTIDESQGAIVNTDAQGIARTHFKLGARAGDGIHRVRAKAVGLTGEVLFFANANANPGDKINVIAGNNQRGIVRQPLPQPFTVAVVDDGANLIQNAHVEFTITQGTGAFQNQLQTYTTTTDTDGRASAVLTLGPEEGLDIQRVTATLIGTEAKAGFTASAFMPGDSGDTKISGVVLDNQDKPISGVTIRVDGHNRQAITNNEGQFTITNVPVGPVHLLADGSTATVEGEWPTLSYNIVTVAGVDNPLNAPIYMVKLDTENAMTVGAQDIDYTLPEVPGFKLTVKAGSVTFPDGSKEGDISVTVVNANKVPMPPPNGMQPQFIVTIQPAGAKFDPPAPLTLPNTDGHAPGAQVEMYSYDHDLEEFVTIGLGTVSKDGTIIESNPGVGVIKAGWHCGSQPDGSGCTDGCDYCEDCDDNCNCDLVPTREKEKQDPHDCKTLLCDGSSVAAAETSDLEDIPYDCKKPDCVGKKELQSPDAVGASSDHRECQKCEEGTSAANPDVNGIACEDDCGVCDNGNCNIDETKPLKAERQSDTDCKTLLCGGGSTPKPSEQPISVCRKCSLEGEDVADENKNGIQCEGDVCKSCWNGECVTKEPNDLGDIDYKSEFEFGPYEFIIKIPHIYADAELFINRNEECCTSKNGEMSFQGVGSGSVSGGIEHSFGIPIPGPGTVTTIIDKVCEQIKKKLKNNKLIECKASFSGKADGVVVSGALSVTENQCHLDAEQSLAKWIGGGDIVLLKSRIEGKGGITIKNLGGFELTISAELPVDLSWIAANQSIDSTVTLSKSVIKGCVELASEPFCTDEYVLTEGGSVDGPSIPLPSTIKNLVDSSQ